MTEGCERKMNDIVHYDFEMKNEPTCQIYVEFRDVREADAFFGVLKTFAESHDIPGSRLRATRNYSAPQFRSAPMYQSEQVIISSMAVIAPDEPYGQSRMSVLRRDYPIADFKKLADSFAESFRQAFNNRVRFTFDEGHK